MSRFLTLAIALATSVAFGRLVPVDRFTETFSQLITLFSIMIAAVLVRLNRGMPTLDWKKVEASNRSDLTAAVVSLTQQYLYISAILAASLIETFGLSLAGKSVLQDLGLRTQSILMYEVGAAYGVSLARMAYVVWRDYDIVRLQKRIIDAAAEKEQTDAATAAATAKVGAIKAGGLRKVGEPINGPWSG